MYTRTIRNKKKQIEERGCTMKMIKELYEKIRKFIAEIKSSYRKAAAYIAFPL